MPLNPHIDRIHTDHVLNCDGCNDLIFTGEPAYQHDQLFVVGCCRQCVEDAAESKTANLVYEGEETP